MIFKKKPVHANFVKEAIDITDETVLEEMFLNNSIELNNMYTEIMMDNYASAAIGFGENNLVILREGFNDFVEGIKKFLAKVIKICKDFFQKATEFFKYVFSSNKAKIEYIDDLINNLSGDKKTKVLFTKEMYKYNIDMTCPIINTKINKLVSEINGEMNNIDSMSGKEINDLKEKYSSTKAKNKLKDEVLRLPSASPDKTVSDRILDAYHGGKNKSKVDITPNKCSDFIKAISKMKDEYEDTLKSYSDFIDALTDIESYFNKPVKIVNHDSSKQITYDELKLSDDKISSGKTEYKDASTDSVKNYTRYYSIRFDQIKHMVSIYKFSYAAYFSAMRETIKELTTIVKSSKPKIEELKRK